jgi:hypothetical protein
MMDKKGGELMSDMELLCHDLAVALAVSKSGGDDDVTKLLKLYSKYHRALHTESLKYESLSALTGYYVHLFERDEKLGKI